MFSFRVLACMLFLSAGFMACSSGFIEVQEPQGVMPSPLAGSALAQPQREAADRFGGGAPPPTPVNSPAARKGRERAPVETMGDGEPEAKQSPKEAPARLVHYSGYVKLRTANISDTLQQASEIADAVGGYVEHLQEHAVVLRVPVAQFQDVFSKVARLPETLLLDRSMSARDVTDAFFAVGLRLKTLKSSRDRLIALLSKARGAREKLRLLREVKRLTEEIDQLEMNRNTLASLASFSQLSVEVVPYEIQEQTAAQEPIAAFRWIHRLSPFRRDVADSGGEFELGVATGFVRLSMNNSFVTQSADGAAVWASRLENVPEGDSAYWLAAIRARLDGQYAGSEIVEVGDFQVVRFIDASPTAYRYLVAVRAQGDELVLIEVYYPSLAHEERHQTAVLKTIAQTAKKGGGA